MNRVLIVYASHYGQTRAIAVSIAQHLRNRHLDVDLGDLCAPHRLPPPEDYDAVVLGSRIELGKHAKELLAYVTAHRETLQAIPTAFFSVSMAASTAGGNPDPEGYMARTFARLAWHPVVAASFAGALPYRRYGWLMRHVMRGISRRAGHPTDTSRDHELTDWTAVAAFAAKIAYVISGPMTRDAAQPRLH